MADPHDNFAIDYLDDIEYTTEYLNEVFDGISGDLLPKSKRKKTKRKRRYRVRYNTYDEVVQMFEADILPLVVEHYGPFDEIAIDQAWNDYTDMLCREGQIREKDYEEWTYEAPDPEFIYDLTRDR